MTNNLFGTHLMQIQGGKRTQPLVGPPAPPNILHFDNDGDFGQPGKLPELRSEAVNEIMSSPPNWLLRWGITVFFAILLVVLTICNFVKYPDLVKGNFVLMADKNPKTVLTRTDGRLETLWVKDNEEVKKGQILGLIQSTAHYEEIIKLEQSVNDLLLWAGTNNFDKLNNFNLPLLFRLGDIQKPYQVFHDNFIRSKSYIGTGAVVRKREVLLEEKNTLNEIKRNLTDQQVMLLQEVEMAKEELEKRVRLFSKGFMSEAEVNTAKNALLAKRQALEQSKNTLSNQQLSEVQKKQEIIENDYDVLEQKNNLVQSLTVLKSDLEAWKQKYLLISPSDGHIVFPIKLEPNQFVKSGQEICFVQPETTSFYGNTSLGQYNLGKVKTGQKVIIKLNSYPYQQYGMITGKIDQIAPLPKDSLYQVHIALPLVTDTDFSIPPKTGMTGTAEIVTEDLSLLERFFSEFRKLAK